MALNNLERLAAGLDRATFVTTLVGHPGAPHLLATLGGGSQFLSDTLRRHPTFLPWLLEPAAMRQWAKDDLAQELARDLAPFARPQARRNVLRRFKYRHLLRIGSRDLLGDADLTVTTEELSRLADVCLDAAWRMGEEELRSQHGTPLTPAGDESGLAVIGMGKLGGEELNYSSDIDLIFVYSEDGETSGGPGGVLPNGEYFARVARRIVEALESVTEEGHAFRVDLRLRPEGRMGALILSLEGYRAYYAERALLWERQALVKARPCAGDERVGARFLDLVRPYVYQPGVDRRIVAQVSEMKRAIDRSLRAKGHERLNVKLGTGGIREVEFLVQALQLLYGGDDPWLRERKTLRAIFRLVERGYLSHALGRVLSRGYTYLRTVEHRLQILHEFQTHTLPDETGALGRLARRMGVALPPDMAAKRFLAEYRAATREVHQAFAQFFQASPAADPGRLRIPSMHALRATGFTDPERARQNLRLILEGRPLVPYPDPMRRALRRLLPVLLDAVWRSADPDEALNQFERFVSAMGPRAGYLELLADHPDLLVNLVNLCARGEFLTQLLVSQPELLTGLADPTAIRNPKREGDFSRALAPVLAAGLSAADRKDRLRRSKAAEELGITWRWLLGVTDAEGFSRELTALAEAAVAVAWVLALSAEGERSGVPRDARGRFIPAVIVALGKLGGRELTIGSDLDLFVVYAGDGATDGPERVEAHVFYDRAVERLSSLLGDITSAGTAFPVDLRLRPGSKGSGFASSLAAFEQYYREWADLWERQTLTKARLVGGDPRLGRAVRGLLRTLVYDRGLSPVELKEIREVRQRMELELGKETPGRLHVKFGRGGLVDVEFIAQTLALAHGAAYPGVRRANTVCALRALCRAGLLSKADGEALLEHYGWLRRVAAALRLFGARPRDALETAGPMPGRLARVMEYPGRAEFLADYARRTGEVRLIYGRVFYPEGGFAPLPVPPPRVAPAKPALERGYGRNGA
ncbi:MAG: bifunctional [glutamate--ammonia ligase]-adenylyl-L-tyrosine phosphorylase/[glutamate--ammonia-ligase] adenylyltransferase [Candidatus Rokubacteria bacterium]|nr:bifunctional [glutamate--ammonia ligase]-adenylyl-L-tyrosine phosphorylase/[glutamate--ammonia-ligase] adenylyltransferase [Candidatus Rokubacteria bacterium]